MASHGKDNSDAADPAVASSRAYHNLHVTTEPCEAVDHLRFADAPKPPPQHLRQLRLGNAQHFRGLLLAPLASLDDLADLGRQLRFDQHSIGVDHAEIGIDVAAAFFDDSHFRIPLACASATFNRSYIRSMLGLDLAIPCAGFF